MAHQFLFLNSSTRQGEPVNIAAGPSGPAVSFPASPLRGHSHGLTVLSPTSHEPVAGKDGAPSLLRETSHPEDGQTMQQTQDIQAVNSAIEVQLQPPALHGSIRLPALCDRRYRLQV